MTNLNILSLVLLLGLLAPGLARAEILQAPAGGAAVPLGPERVACAAALPGWSVEAGGQAVRPPPAGQGIGDAVTLPVAEPGHCGDHAVPISLIALGPRPSVDPGSVIADVEAGTLLLRGRGLRGLVLRWEAAGKVGSDVCTDPRSLADVSARGPAAPPSEQCTLAIPRGLRADPQQLRLWFLPAGARVREGATYYDEQGHRVPLEDRAQSPARVLIASLVPASAAVDSGAGTTRIALPYPEAVATIDCEDATCVLDGADLTIRDEHGSDEQLAARFHLRPHVALRREGGSDTDPEIDLPIQRCPAALVSPPPLRQVSDQRLVLRVSGRCLEGALQFVAPSGPLVVERSEVQEGQRYVVLQLSRPPPDELLLTVRRSGATAALVSVRSRSSPWPRLQLELPGRGAVDFIPTNGEAQVKLPGGSAGRLVPLPLEGVYEVRRDSSGSYFVRGVPGGAGSVALQVAVRSEQLPASLRDLDLAVVPEVVQRSLREANLPIALAPAAQGDAPLLELLCADGEGHVRRLRPGITEAVTYRARDTCRLVMHRDRLRPEDGVQELQVTISVTSSDGENRSEARSDRRVVLKPGRGSDATRVQYLSGVEAPFDRVLLRVALVDDESHYAVIPDERDGSAQVQWSVVMGTGRLRLYGTTAIPTGLYRIADAGHEGILTLNAGALLRLVLLSREGRESPIGVEAGAMWLGIAGDEDPTSAAHGEAALVAGLGLGVPIANQSRLSQTSINLHAWFEYEVSRAFRSGAGTPFGFVFGPSLSIGNLGINF